MKLPLVEGWGAAAVVGIVIFVGVMALLRAVNVATIEPRVVSPRDGVECAIVSSMDSVAVDCWIVGEVEQWDK